MRRLTYLLAGTALLVMLLAAPASAAPAIQITGMTCSTLSATGSDLPPNAELDLAVVNQDNGKVLRRVTAPTTATGAFKVDVKVQTAGVKNMRLVVASQDGTRIGFADYGMAAGHETCPLPYTGPGHQLALLAAGAGALALGLALLRSQAYRGTHLGRA
jgi:hypothetical protein